MARVIATILLLMQGVCLPVLAQAATPPESVTVAQAPKDEKPKLTPDEKMSSRFPQPVRVGDLIGLPVLDDDDSIIGFIGDVVVTPTGRIQLVVPYGRWFGWIRWGGPFAWNRRLVGVPIETVAILGKQVDALDMPPEAFDRAPTFQPTESTPIGRDATIKIAIGRR
jgi:hypothetical protein